MNQALQEEEYIHLEQCLSDLGDAWRILKVIEEDGAASRLTFSAFKYAVIAYCRPFKASYGTAKRKHVLQADFLPPHHIAVHKEVVDLRDWIPAHSDIDKSEAEIYVSATPDGKMVTHIRNAEHGDSLWGQREKFLALIEFAIEALTPTVGAAKAALPITREFEF
jgi:hypothetical protein